MNDEEYNDPTDFTYGRLVRVEFELNTRELAEEWADYLRKPQFDGRVHATWTPGAKVSVRVF